MTINFKKDWLPHILGISIFYALVVLYFSPLVFDGKVIFQGDILKWEASAKEIMDFREATGEEALWTNSMFGGMPGYFISIDFPGDITNALVSVLTLGLPHPVNGLFLGMVAMYVLLLTFGVRPAFAVIGSAAFAFNSFNLLSLAAGHNAKIWAECLIPVILAGIHLAFERKRLLGSALLALGLLLQFKFNHVQITYYTLIICLIYAVVRIISEWKKEGLPQLAKTAGFLLIGAILAVGGNIGRLATALEYSTYSTRGAVTLETEAEGLSKEYAFGWSNGIMESFTLMIPDFYGGGSTTPLPEDSASEKALRANGIDPTQINGFVKGAPTYWGDQPFTGGPIYGGIILVFLAILSFWVVPKQSLITFGSIIFLSLLFSWGKNLSSINYLLFDYLPAYNKFRAVSMALGMTLFAIPVLGMLALERVVRTKEMKAFLMASGVTAGILLLFALAAGMFRFAAPSDAGVPEWLADALKEDRKSMLQASAWRSLGFLAAALALIYFTLKEKTTDLILGAGLFALVMIDLWTINRPYLNDESFQNSPSKAYFAETPAEAKVAEDPSYYRVLDLNESLTQAGKASYRFHAIGGYHGAKLRRFQDLIDNRINPELSGFISKAQEGDFQFGELQSLNMLNTKYIIAGNAANSVFENPQINGAAWIPSAILPVSSNQEEMDLLGQINTRETATVNRQEFGEIPVGLGQVSLIQYEPNEVSYQVDMQKEGLVVFSEIHYPIGWKATISGEEVDILRVNYLLRGLNVPAGSHEVVFHFSPSSYTSTKTPMIIFQYLILVGLIGGGYLTLKKQNGRIQG